MQRGGGNLSPNLRQPLLAHQYVARPQALAGFAQKFSLNQGIKQMSGFRLADMGSPR